MMSEDTFQASNFQYYKDTVLLLPGEVEHY